MYFRGALIDAPVGIVIFWLLGFVDKVDNRRSTEISEILEVSQQKRERPSDYFADWKEREALAEAMIPAVGK